MKVYLLECSSGSYEDYCSWVSNVYATKELAQEAKNRIMESKSIDNLNIDAKTVDAISDLLEDMCYPENETEVILEYFPDVDIDAYNKYWELVYNEDHEPEIIEMEVIQKLDNA